MKVECARCGRPLKNGEEVFEQTVHKIVFEDKAGTAKPVTVKEYTCAPKCGK